MATTTYTAPPNTPPLVAATDATTSIMDNGGGALTIKRTPADGGVICTLHSHLGSDQRSITLDPGQTCMEDNGATLAYTMGRSSLNADGTYSNSVTWTLTNMTKTGAPILGTGTASGVCTKTM